MIPSIVYVSFRYYYYFSESAFKKNFKDEIEIVKSLSKKDKFMHDNEYIKK